MADITSTELERTVDAAIAALGAWCYPSDLEVRAAAVLASNIAGFDYVAMLAATLESQPELSVDTARRLVALAWLDRVLGLVAKGAEPRPGILSTGKHADALGRDPDAGEDPAYGEGWDA